MPRRQRFLLDRCIRALLVEVRLMPEKVPRQWSDTVAMECAQVLHDFSLPSYSLLPR